jgi:hypothetical protein
MNKYLVTLSRWTGGPPRERDETTQTIEAESFAVALSNDGVHAQFFDEMGDLIAAFTQFVSVVKVTE